MIAFLLRRMAYAIPVLLGVALLTLLLFDVAAGDPVAMKLGKNPSAAEVEALRAELGLYDTFWVRYLSFIQQYVSLDFGTSWADNTPVATIFWRGLGPTLSLTLPAFFLGTGVAVVLAMLVSFYRGTMLDRVVTAGAIAGISISSLIYILVGQWLLADQWKLFPIWGYEYGLKAPVFLALPVLIWVCVSVGTDVRYFRTVALEEIGRDYVRTARSKGLTETRV
ncbi:MAG: ABC transporter permease, partial [Myxococcota bacterium]|nr:ABC transporter permease [Myxococcota bacterium]